jgi:hypothetical protein
VTGQVNENARRAADLHGWATGHHGVAAFSPAMGSAPGECAAEGWRVEQDYRLVRQVER